MLTRFAQPARSELSQSTNQRMPRTQRFLYDSDSLSCSQSIDRVADRLPCRGICQCATQLSRFWLPEPLTATIALPRLFISVWWMALISRSGLLINWVAVLARAYSHARGTVNRRGFRPWLSRVPRSSFSSASSIAIHTSPRLSSDEIVCATFHSSSST